MQLIPKSKHECLFADLSSAVVANFSMVSDVDNANPSENKFGSYSLTGPNYTSYGYHQNQQGGRY